MLLKRATKKAINQKEGLFWAIKQRRFTINEKCTYSIS